MKPDQITAINQRINQLHSDFTSSGITCELINDSLGNFKIVSSLGDKTVIVVHGYDPYKKETVKKSPTVDLYFINTNGKYLLVMTEADPEDYIWNIDESERLIKHYFHGNFEYRIIKKWFSGDREDLWINGADVTYHHAIRIRPIN